RGQRRRAASRSGRVLAALADLRGLAATVTQVIELGSPDRASADDLDLLNDWGVKGEGALNADAVADLANGERLADATAGSTDHHPLEDLHAGLVALNDSDVNLQGVAGTELGNVVSQRGRVDKVKGLHVVSWKVPQVTHGGRSSIGQHRPCPLVETRADANVGGS